MYGTIARIKIDPARKGDLEALVENIGLPPGELARYVYQMDADPGEIYLVAVFESRDAYLANANSPEQHQRYLRMRALMLEDPEWHDGEIVHAISHRAIP